MNSKERFLTALSNGQPDKVPVFELWIDKPIVIELASILGFAQDLGPEETSFPAGDSIGDPDLYCLLVTSDHSYY